MDKKKIVLFVFIGILQILIVLFLAYICWNGELYFISIALLVTTILEQVFIITRIRSSKNSNIKEK